MPGKKLTLKEMLEMSEQASDWSAVKYQIFEASEFREITLPNPGGEPKILKPRQTLEPDAEYMDITVYAFFIYPPFTGKSLVKEKDKSQFATTYRFVKQKSDEDKHNTVTIFHGTVDDLEMQLAYFLTDNRVGIVRALKDKFVVGEYARSIGIGQEMATSDDILKIRDRYQEIERSLAQKMDKMPEETNLAERIAEYVNKRGEMMQKLGNKKKYNAKLEDGRTLEVIYHEGAGVGNPVEHSSPRLLGITLRPSREDQIGFSAEEQATAKPDGIQKEFSGLLYHFRPITPSQNIFMIHSSADENRLYEDPRIMSEYNILLKLVVDHFEKQPNKQGE